MNVFVGIVICAIYIVIGALVCYFIRLLAGDNIGAVFAGLFWPVVAPFMFACLLAERKIKMKPKNQRRN